MRAAGVYLMPDSAATPPAKIVTTDFKSPAMATFVQYIVHNIEHERIQGRQGWHEHFEAYEWPRRGAGCKEGIAARRRFHDAISYVRESDNQDATRLKSQVCNAIAEWGGIKAPVSEGDADRIFSTIEILSAFRDARYIDCGNIFGRRVATASKAYYLADPWAWTIYDSRVAYALNQFAVAFKNENATAFDRIRDHIVFAVPMSKTIGRKSFFGNIWNDRYAPQWFVRASLLLREVASALNAQSFPAPRYAIDNGEGWALYHVEMVLFMLGKCRWVEQRHA